MFESIILLTGPVEQSALASTLCRHNPGLAVKAVETAADLAALERDTLRRARLIGFATPVIVPPDILQALGYGAYNFHPGPPQYPGFAPAQFAIYDQAAEFGATVHEMADRVDSGPIVDVARFSVPAGISVIELETLAYMQLVEMFGGSPKRWRPRPTRCRVFRCTGATSETRAVPIARPATFPSTSAGTIFIAASTRSAATITTWRRRSICMAWNFER